MKKETFLFIVPPYVGTFWHNAWRVPYYGVAITSSYLKERGFNVELVDCQMNALSVKKLKKDLQKREKPEYIGIPTVYGSIHNVYIVAKAAKEIFPDVKVVVGGLPATFAYQRIFKESPYVDICILGEGEETALELMEKKGKEELIKGIAYRKGESFVLNEKREPEDINKYPSPDYPLFEYENYKTKSFPYETSRGCPFACDFCCQGKKEGRRLREKTTEKVLQELEEMVDYGIHRVMIVDNDFLTNNKRAKEIMRGVIERKINKRTKLFFATRVSNILRDREEILDLMQRSNVKSTFLGIESLAEKNRDSIGKIKDIKELKSLFEDLERRKILVIPSYVIGFPNENVEDIRETLKAAVFLNTEVLKLNIYTPYPGTDLYNEMEKKGLIDENIPLTNYDNVHKIYKNPLDLEKIFRDFIKLYYKRKSYVERDGRRLKNLGTIKKEYDLRVLAEKKFAKKVKENEFIRKDIAIEKINSFSWKKSS